jgi:acyl-CoA thioesterase-1
LLPALVLLVLAAACGSESRPSSRREQLAPGDAPAPEALADDATAPAPRIPAGAPRVAFLGDSIAAGLHLSPDQAFPAVLQRRLAQRGLPFELVNAGVSGDTTAGGLARVDWLLSGEPDVLVVELGANDGLRGVPVESIEENLRETIERAKAAGARVLLLGMRIPPSYGEEYSEAVAAVYARIATEERVAFVPFFMEGVAGDPSLTLPDGLHPTAEGHRRLARNVEGALADLLEPLTGGTGN